MKFEDHILANLINKPAHGYELKRILEEIGDSCNDTGRKINNNMLYPVLSRYEKEGLITKETVLQEGKPNRIVYSITDAGRLYHYVSLNTVTPQLTNNREEFHTRLTFFAYMTPATRRKLLAGRTKYLKNGIDACNTRFKKGDLDEESRQRNQFYIDLSNLEMKQIEFFRQRIDEPCLIPEKYLTQMLHKDEDEF